MTTDAIIPSTPATTAQGPTALETLAQRFRPHGLFLVLINNDGSVGWSDPQASVFFSRFVLPSLHSTSERARRDLARSKDILLPAGLIPGVLVGATPLADDRDSRGTLLLIGKCRSFVFSDAILNVCGELGLDPQWLVVQADALSAYNESSMIRKVEFLACMLGDQLRLDVLETEIRGLTTQLANTYEELSLIYQLSGGMKVNRSAAEFFQQACLDLMELMNVRGMAVSLPGAGMKPQPPVLYGQATIPASFVHRLSEELLAAFSEHKAPILLTEHGRDTRFAWISPHVKGLLAVPFLRQDQVLGCIFAIDKIDREFDSLDSKLLLSIANESAVYLENSLLFADSQQLMMGLLHSLISAVDAKDTYTCGHSERVADLSRELANAIQLPQSQVERIYMAGLLHDVGKIGVPEAVLQKTGRLTPEEFDLMKKHPAIGARILKDIRQVEDIVPGVLHHHERYDGKGYPHNLCGEQIPLMGRIICLADCFDAMTSNRTYRRALPLEVALIEIRRCAGTQFDPRLTDAFLGMGQEHFRRALRDAQERSYSLQELRSAA